MSFISWGIVYRWTNFCIKLSHHNSQSIKTDLESKKMIYE